MTIKKPSLIFVGGTNFLKICSLTPTTNITLGLNVFEVKNALAYCMQRP
jgi:hypothetical protein